MSVKGKIVLITGSADGIGRAIAAAFAHEGAKLVLCDLKEEKLQETAAEMREAGAEDVLAIPYNASRPEDIDMVCAKMIEHYGDVDVLVNNVGIAGPTAPVHEIKLEDWDATFAVDVRGTFQMIKNCAPYMMKKKEGKIVSMSSMSGLHSLVNRTPYAAAKMAVIGITRTVAMELGAYNINVNCVCPANIQNERGTLIMQRQAEQEGVTVDEILQRKLGTYCLKRRVPMEDVAQMVLFLSDDERSHSITGADFPVSCGAYV